MNHVSDHKKAVTAVLLACTFAVMLYGAGCFAYFTVFTSPISHDDEGYLMISVKLFNEGQALYDTVFSQYGPFYYVYHWLLHGISGQTVSHNATRLITVAHWLAISSIMALFIFRITRWPWLAALTFLQVSYHLAPLRNEPGHPQSLGLLLIALSLFAATFASEITVSRTSRFASIALGVMLGALLLIKINAGLFSGAALALAFLFSCKPDRITRFATIGIGALAILLPVVLMWRDLGGVHHAWRHYCLLTAFSLISLQLVLWREWRGELTGRDLLPVGFATLGCILVICLMVIARGTSMAGLIQGVLLKPLSLSSAFNIPSKVGWNGTLTGILSLIIAVIYVITGYRRKLFRHALTLLKLLIGTCLVLMSFTWHPQAMLVLGTPFIWCLFVPVRTMAASPLPQTRFPVLLLSLMAGLHTLQAYPVCGTQQTVASACLLPMAVLFLGDGLRAFKRTTCWFEGCLQPAHVVAAFALLVAYSLAIPLPCQAAFGTFPALRREYQQAIPLGLPGSSRLRMASAADVAELNWAANNLRAHADAFITLPGLNSFYFWTETHPPTGLNTTAWLKLLSQKEQQSILTKLDEAASPCVLCNMTELEFWGNPKGQPSGVLLKGVMARYKPALNRGHYSLLTRKGRNGQEIAETLIAGERSFDGVDDVLPLPQGLFRDASSFSLTFSFQTKTSGVLLAMQATDYPVPPSTTGFCLLINEEGILMCQLGAEAPVRIESPIRLDDNAPHTVDITATSDGIAVSVDGASPRHVSSGYQPGSCASAQFGAGWDATGKTWERFTGTLSKAVYKPAKK